MPSDNGLYALIGERKFRKLLNLDTGTSLTFVIDTTGSMSDEIQAVKEEAIRLVNIHRGTCLAASKYVVVPFNDPGWLLLSYVYLKLSHEKSACSVTSREKVYAFIYVLATVKVICCNLVCLYARRGYSVDKVVHNLVSRTTQTENPADEPRKTDM